MKKRFSIIHVLTIGFTIFLAHSSLFGQADFSSTSDSVWVYRLTPEQQYQRAIERADWYFQGQKPEKGDFFIAPSQRVATIPYDSTLIAKYSLQDFSPGVYIWMYVKDNRVISFSDHRSGLREPQLLLGKKQSWIWVGHEKARNNELKLTLKKEQLSYDTSKNLFLLPGKKKRGTLKVEIGNDISYFKLDKSGARLPQKYLRYSSVEEGFQGSDRKYQRKWLGYIAFNKPRYRPGDTLKLKAYCMDRYGVPLDMPLELKWRGNTLAEIIPGRDGLYTHELVLSDSLGLRLDQEHTFYLRHGELGFITENEFTYEDYELDEATFHLKLENEAITYGQPLEIFAYTKDANEMDLPGGKVEILIFFHRMLTSPVAPTYLPRILYHDTLPLVTSRSPILTLKPEKLPQAHCKYYIEARFTTESREQQTKSAKFELKPPLLEPEVTWIGDSLIINGPKDSLGKIFFMGQNLDEVEILSDTYRKRISPIIEIIFWEMDSEMGLIMPPEISTLIQPLVSRKKDSAFFEVQNPHGLPLQVILWRNDRLLRSWQLSQSLDTAFTVERGEHFRLSLQTLWAGSTCKIERILPIFDEYLKVEVEQPSQAQPGEELDLLVTVSDARGNPVEGADLTSMAVNARFKEDNVPDLPFTGVPIRTKQYQLDGKIWPFYATRDAKRLLDSTSYKALHLDDQPYYRLTRPDSLTEYYWKTDQKEGAQFAPYVYKNGVQVPIDFIYLNGRMIYFSGSDAQPTYSFAGPEDTVTLQVRTYNREYTIRSVVLRRGEKLEISIHRDQISSRVTWKEKPESYTWQEMEMVNRNFIYVTTASAKGSRIIFWQGGRVFRVNGIKNSEEYLIGPIFGEEVGCAVPGQFIRRLRWQSGHTHEIAQHYERLWRRNGIISHDDPALWQKPVQPLGEKLILLEDVFPVAGRTPDGNLINSLTKAIAGGDLILSVEGPTGAIALTREADSQNIWLFKGQDINRIPADTYHLEVFNPENKLILEDTITIKSDSILFLPKMMWASSDSLPVTVNKWKAGYYPQSDRFINSYLIDSQFSREVLVTDTLGNPVAGAEVVCFYEGRQVQGSFTDSTGKVILPIISSQEDQERRFEIVVLHPEYRPFRQVVTGEDQQLTIVLRLFSSHAPVKAYLSEGLSQAHYFEAFDDSLASLSIAYLQENAPEYVKDDLFTELTGNRRIKKILLHDSIFLVKREIEPHLNVDPVPDYLSLTGFGNPLTLYGNKGEISGRVYDEYGDPLAFATILIYQGDLFVNGARSDENGFYKITPLEDGRYTLKAKYLTTDKTYEDVSSGIVFDVVFSDGIQKLSSQEVVIEEYKIPVFDKAASSGMTIGINTISPRSSATPRVNSNPSRRRKNYKIRGASSTEESNDKE
ncbi:MAG: carboxypeptidase regulatory-like domain-containing protein, partial [Bacteroidota bacterium]